MSKIKISVVGCGYWGKNLVRNFSELSVLASVCDTKEELARSAAQTYKVPSLSLEQVLKSDVDGIVIAAPAIQHYELALKALNAGKHVFVEKPLSLNVNEAKILCDLSLHLNQHLMVGHLLQYHPAFLELKKIISKGILGQLQYIYSNRLNLGKFRTEENILWSFAPHDISMILGLAGELPETVYATGACYLNPHIHDVTTTHLSFKNGLQSHIFVSWLHPYKEQKLVVVGDRGMAVFDDGLSWDEKLKLYPHQVSWIDGFPHPKKADVIHIPLEPSEPLKLECKHFIDSIENNKKPITDGLEGLHVLQVLEAAQQSLHSKKTVFLEKENAPYFVHDTAIVDEGCQIGKGTKIWNLSHILKGTIIGEDCIIGQNVMIGPDVIVGNRCKIQNNVSLYKGVTLEDGVFCGPSCVFTNVHNPRAEIERKDEFRPTYVERGVTIGANATIICGHRLGAYSLVGAGAVITKDVKPHAVMAGNPARQIGWVSHAGEKLEDDLVCSRERRSYCLNEFGDLIEINPVTKYQRKS
ncbi:MAG: oxidoreductase [Alphaproteobacteria bacterium 16-39-46]|nr:MAG: oxidoreductase [Alphaproteobacteria bacterium 16-39-46]OZA44521.1 MAG: oxidoreductase [Alphaproteobacteria bacterium 17-39-52]HQS83368.1 Gfo/Idh/MocA family oxidoreductase [Alphaproteobacteria bacterium]HQS93055.1 Gfo/Idh/MocA family oxidoreductase [Alphaproteobacteria bacterium]